MKISHEAVKELLAKGHIDREIAAILGCTYSQVRHIRRWHLGAMSSRDQKRTTMSAKIKDLHEQGFNDSEIVKFTGYRSSTVQDCRKNFLGLDAHFEHRTYLNDEDRIRGYIIRNIKGNAKRRDIEFNITYKDFTLPEYCPLLNLRLKYRGEDGFNDNDRATLDRIDNTKGYIPGNVWILSRLANTMKNEATNEQLHLFCQNMLSMLENQRALGGITDSESLDP